MRELALLPRSDETIGFAELIGAFTYALDMTEGQPAGHALRSCYIASRIGQQLGLPEAERHDLYYAALLKDLGCSSNAARIAEIYQADDLAFKHDYKLIGPGLPDVLGFVFSHSARGESLRRRIAVIANIMRNGRTIAHEMIATRCTRGADIARTLGFPEAVAQGVYHLDEHWDGSGRPDGLAGSAIPLFSRIALLAQIADVFHSHGGPQAARDEVAARAGSFLDPALAEAFEHVTRDGSLWAELAPPGLETALLAFAPPDRLRPVDEALLDTVAQAFGQVVDAKSPYTAGHSGRVADYAAAVAERLDVVPARRAPLRRAALLHDIGKLGVSSAILEKPGTLDDREWVAIRDHAVKTREILGRIGAFSSMADLAAAHHERLDGAGYPLGLADSEIARETRIITVCDFYDALIADRPYRGAMERDAALAIMRREAGRSIDADCFAALVELT